MSFLADSCFIVSKTSDTQEDECNFLSADDSHDNLAGTTVIDFDRMTEDLRSPDDDFSFDIFLVSFT